MLPFVPYRGLLYPSDRPAIKKAVARPLLTLGRSHLPSLKGEHIEDYGTIAIICQQS